MPLWVRRTPEYRGDAPVHWSAGWAEREKKLREIESLEWELQEAEREKAREAERLAKLQNREPSLAAVNPLDGRIKKGSLLLKGHNGYLVLAEGRGEMFAEYVAVTTPIKGQTLVKAL